jgi:transcriptional regulator with XRE-family HTH domain
MLLPRLKPIRIEKGFTTTELAALAGMTERNISRIESGKGTTLNTGKRIAGVLRVKLDEMKRAA